GVPGSSGSPQSASAPLSIAIVPGTMHFGTVSLPGGQAQSAYSAMLAASGGTPPYTWSVASGALPAGLALNPSSGAITGTPTDGPGTFTVRVTDSASPPQAASKPLSIAIPPAITTSSLPGGQAQSAYNASLAA